MGKIFDSDRHFANSWLSHCSRGRDELYLHCLLACPSQAWPPSAVCPVSQGSCTKHTHSGTCACPPPQTLWCLPTPAPREIKVQQWGRYRQDISDLRGIIFMRYSHTCMFWFWNIIKDFTHVLWLIWYTTIGLIMIKFLTSHALTSFVFLRSTDSSSDAADVFADVFAVFAVVVFAVLAAVAVDVVVVDDDIVAVVVVVVVDDVDFWLLLLLLLLFKRMTSSALKELRPALLRASNMPTSLAASDARRSCSSWNQQQKLLNLSLSKLLSGSNILLTLTWKLRMIL